MGCFQGNLPHLICQFEKGNEIQKSYCIKLKDNFKSEHSIEFTIQSKADEAFSIKIEKNKKELILQNDFNDEEEILYQTLQKAYKFLDDN
jgi:hypothetical protein